jgi:hypothetical protein
MEEWIPAFPDKSGHAHGMTFEISKYSWDPRFRGDDRKNGIPAFADKRREGDESPYN